MPYKDPEKRKEAWRRSYYRNHDKQKTQIKERQKRYDERNRKFVLDWLREHPCADCGEADLLVLEFDHIADDKAADICHMMDNGTSIERLKQEIDKCEVVCANCHRRRTRQRSNDWRYSMVNVD